MNRILKIDSKFATYIFRGEKEREYRKQNKWYIKKDDTITFVNLDCTIVYGTAKVKYVNYISRRTLTQRKDAPKWYNETMQFIEQQYQNEDIIVEIGLYDIKEENNE